APYEPACNPRWIRLIFLKANGTSLLSESARRTVLRISLERRSGQCRRVFSGAVLAAVSDAGIIPAFSCLLTHQHDDDIFGCAKLSTRGNSAVLLERAS